MTHLSQRKLLKPHIFVLPLYFFFIASTVVYAQHKHANSSDSLSHKQIKKQKREEFRKTHQMNMIKLSAVNASMDTEIAFKFLNNIFSVNLGMEDDLGLPDTRAFFNGAYAHRFNKRSGIFAQYYGIKRSKDYVLDQDIIFLEDTIKAGVLGSSYFETQVFSAGYLLTLLQDERTFLAFYFNIYLMQLRTGIDTDLVAVDAKLKYALPLPDVGLLFLFEFTKWLHFDFNLGFFQLNLKDFDGMLYDLSARLAFKPVKNFGITLSYQVFDIRVNWLFENIPTTVDYNFKGPGLGLNFSF